MRMRFVLGILLLVLLSYVWLTPFTKVEESFNTQAVFDLFSLFSQSRFPNDNNNNYYYGFQVFQTTSAFDHLQFPGVVPRSFLGAVAIAALLTLFRFILISLASALYYLRALLAIPPEIVLRVSEIMDRLSGATRVAKPQLLLGRGILAFAWWLGVCRVCTSLSELDRCVYTVPTDDGGEGNRSHQTAKGSQGEPYPYFHAAVWFAVMVCVQFHLPFYSSRFLPNTFALVLATFALAEYLNTLVFRPSDWVAWTLLKGAISTVASATRSQDHVCHSDDNMQCNNGVPELSSRQFICRAACKTCAFLSFAVVVFRCDLLPLLAAVVFDFCFVRGVLPVKTCAKWTLISATIGTALSMSVDTVLWWGSAYSRSVPFGLLWPEGMVFYFNAVQQKSSLWGVSPWHWYFTSAIPRGIGPVGVFLAGILLPSPHSPAPPSVSGGGDLALASVLGPSRLALLLGAAVWASPVVCLSIIGHKELRFIFPSLVGLLAFCAVGLSRFWRCSSARVLTSVTRATARHVSLLFVSFIFLLSTLTTMLRGVASVYNYPGGHAMEALYSPGLQEQNDNGQRLNIDTADVDTPYWLGHPALSRPFCVPPHGHHNHCLPINVTSSLSSIFTIKVENSSSPQSENISSPAYGELPLNTSKTMTSDDGFIPRSPRRLFDPCIVHVSPGAAILGISRFLHNDVICRVDKTEGLSTASLTSSKFHFLLTTTEELQSTLLLQFSVIHAQLSFVTLKFDWRRDGKWGFPTPTLVLQPKVLLLERMS